MCLKNHLLLRIMPAQTEKIRSLRNGRLRRWKPRPSGDPFGKDSFVWRSHQFWLACKVEASTPDVSCVVFGTERAHSIRLATCAERWVLCLSSCSYPSDFTIIKHHVHSGMSLKSNVGIIRCQIVMTVSWMAFKDCGWFVATEQRIYQPFCFCLFASFIGANRCAARLSLGEEDDAVI